MALSEDTLRIGECRITCLSLSAVQQPTHLRVSVGFAISADEILSIGPFIGSWRTLVYKLSQQRARGFEGLWGASTEGVEADSLLPRVLAESGFLAQAVLQEVFFPSGVRCGR